MELERIAERLYNILPWWDRDGATLADVVKQLQKDPLYFVEWLLDYIEEQEEESK